MQLQLFCVLPLILLTDAIKVPVEDTEDHAPAKQPDNASNQEQNTYYVSDDTDLDSYLIPPDPHRAEEVLLPNVVKPASYLLPPSPEQQTDYYYKPTETGEQTDWYPVAQAIPPRKQFQAIPIFESSSHQSAALNVSNNTRRGKSHERDQKALPIPSIRLEPPSLTAPDDYVISTSDHLVLPPQEINQPINISPSGDYELYLGAQNNVAHQSFRPKSVVPKLSLHLIPPQPQLLNHKIATKLYPKKFTGFKPVPIPLAQFADEALLEIPRAKPVKYLKPISSSEIDYIIPSDEKANYLYRIAEEKRKLKEQTIGQVPQQADLAVEDAYGKPISTEQETSETNYRHPGRNVYPAPLRQAPPAAPQRDASPAPAPDERTEFRMHGMKGPHSYQFGYDTGKGKNRQFRFEERDNDGQVRGHYGYMDKHGKLRVVNYSAHPELGFHAEAPLEKE